MSTLSDLENEVQKAVYGKDLRRTVANFFEYVPRVRPGSYGNLTQYISNIRTAPRYKGYGTTIIGVQQQIANAVVAIGSALSNQTIINQGSTISSAAIGKPTKTAITTAIGLIVSAIDSSTFSISMSGSNYTSSNPARTVSSGSSYTNTLTASSGWKFQSVSVSMGGSTVPTTVTDRTATINITSVTGNVSITVTTVQDQPGPTPTGDQVTVSYTPQGLGSNITDEISFGDYTLSGVPYKVEIELNSGAYNNGWVIKSATFEKQGTTWTATSLVSIKSGDGITLTPSSGSSIDTVSVSSIKGIRLGNCTHTSGSGAPTSGPAYFGPNIIYDITVYSTT